jgi:amino acid transporter
MLPAFLGKLHPKYNTPVNAIIMIGALSVVAPLFGRRALVWLVDAGGLGIVVAYATVALSFVVLRKREPEMERPFKVRNGMAVGYGALVLSVAIALLYMPFSPAALIWPYEWAIVGGWSALGFAFYMWSRTMHAHESDRIVTQELTSGHSDLGEPA